MPPASAQPWLALVGGALAALALPPLGVWPLAFVGLAAIDRAVAGRGPAGRARVGWLAGIGLLGPGLLWMYEFTPPGYVAAVALSAAIFALGPLLAGPGRLRWLALPAGLVLVDLIRGAWPFDGVPVATLAHTQIGGPLVPVARLGGPLLLGAAVVVGGVALSAAWERAWRAAAAALAAVVVVTVVGWTVPYGRPVGSIDVALVQGGGERGTRAVDTGSERVFAAHVEAVAAVDGPVDLVLLPEDVIDVEGDIVGTREGAVVGAIADSLDTTLVAGVVEGYRERFRNYAVAWGPDGAVLDRYEKNVRVPFGEWIPFRSVVEDLADVSDVPRDAAVGEGPGIMSTPAGDLGVVISWEVFFARRARAAVNAGGEILLVPTNASSFEGSQMPAFELEVARLRAVETGRWVLQAAPTGFSGVIGPDGSVIEHSDLSDREVLSATAGLRHGRTPYTVVGDGPVLAASALSLLGVGLVRRRSLAGTVPSFSPRRSRRRDNPQQPSTWDAS